MKRQCPTHGIEYDSETQKFTFHPDTSIAEVSLFNAIMEKHLKKNNLIDDIYLDFFDAREEMVYGDIEEENDS